MYSRGLEADHAQQAVLLCHPGAGYGALSFALLARQLASNQASRAEDAPSIAIVAIDCRAHGQSSGAASELSLETMIEDWTALLEWLARTWTAPHCLFLLGHSLGGAVIVNWQHRQQQREQRGEWDLGVRGDPRTDKDDVSPDCHHPVLGVIVVDIVEETAVRALSTMPAVLASRPARFSSHEEAIRWSLRRRLNLLAEAAAISIPAQLCPAPDGGYVWRVDLMASAVHWLGWFTGLSSAFVDCERVSRLLVLAERDYLDRVLMIASMQGRFQTAIIRGTGHAIQEDRPQELASLLEAFVRRTMLIVRLNQRRGRQLDR